MPKTLSNWLAYQARQWQLTGRAVQFDHGGVWHKYDGELPGFTDCGRWVAIGTNLRSIVGKGETHPSPFTYQNAGRLCESCFVDEIPLVEALNVAKGVGWRERQEVTP